MLDLIIKNITMCICITGFAYSSTVLKFDEITARTHLEAVIQKCDIRDVAEVLGDSQPVLEEFIQYCPQSLIKYFRDKLNKFTERTSLTVEAYLAQQSESIQTTSSIIYIDRNWEERFQASATSQLLLSQEFKNPLNINKYLALLRGIDPSFENWLHPKLYLYTVSLSSDITNTADNYRVYEAIRDYYRSGGAPLSVLLEIKAAEEKQKKATQAATWHFSDALSWLPFGSRSTSTSSTRSSDEGTPRNDSLSSRGSTPPKAVEDPDKKPLLEKHETIQGPNAQSGLRRRHLSADGDKQ